MQGERLADMDHEERLPARNVKDGQCSKVCKRFCIDRGCITGVEGGFAARAFEQARKAKRMRSITADGETPHLCANADQ